MVRVYSNCDEVELFLKGRSMGKKRPETTESLIAEWTQYGMWQPRHPLAEGARLRHGPFVWSLPYESGTLEAVGSKDGKTYSDTRKTAGPSSQVVLKPDRESMTSGGRDAVRIVAIIADKDGVMVPSANPWLTFETQGPGRLLGTSVLDAVWGMAAINVLSQSSSGEITITASSPGLKSGTCVIASQPAQ